MKKILLLGGSAQQVIAIETAKRLGYQTVLCDYLSDNPGQYKADKFYQVSTTDKGAVLGVAEKEQISGILAYASDPAAPTAAYVAERLGLPGNPYRSVEILCNKGLFRDFLGKHGFYTPKARGYCEVDAAQLDIEGNKFQFPVMIKPVDSSGSKGVSRCDTVEGAKDKLEAAMSHSRGGGIIVEEYVEKFGYQVAGDGLSIDGKLVFRCFANDHFDGRCINPFVPVAASFPYNMPESVHDKIHGEIQRLLSLLGMRTSAYNFDIRIDSGHNVYLMEVAPRCGGNYIPQVIRHATGIDLAECAVKAAMGESVALPPEIIRKGFWAYYAVHSLEEGILKQVAIDREVMENNIVEQHMAVKPGDRVYPFAGANSALGVLLMKFGTQGQMLHMMDNADEWLHVECGGEQG